MKADVPIRDLPLRGGSPTRRRSRRSAPHAPTQPTCAPTRVAFRGGARLPRLYTLDDVRLRRRSVRGASGPGALRRANARSAVPRAEAHSHRSRAGLSDERRAPRLGAGAGAGSAGPRRRNGAQSRARRGRRGRDPLRLSLPPRRARAVASPRAILERFGPMPVRRDVLADPIGHFDAKYRTCDPPVGSGPELIRATTRLIVERWLPRLLHNGDIHTMRSSLEARVPFADAGVLAVAARVSPRRRASPERWRRRSSVKPCAAPSPNPFARGASRRSPKTRAPARSGDGRPLGYSASHRGWFPTSWISARSAHSSSPRARSASGTAPSSFDSERCAISHTTTGCDEPDPLCGPLGERPPPSVHRSGPDAPRPWSRRSLLRSVQRRGISRARGNHPRLCRFRGRPSTSGREPRSRLRGPGRRRAATTRLDRSDAGRDGAGGSGAPLRPRRGAPTRRPRRRPDVLRRAHRLGAHWHPLGWALHVAQSSGARRVDEPAHRDRALAAAGGTLRSVRRKRTLPRLRLPIASPQRRLEHAGARG